MKEHYWQRGKFFVQKINFCLLLRKKEFSRQDAKIKTQDAKLIFASLLLSVFA
jgi:hypothetical protein